VKPGHAIGSLRHRLAQLCGAPHDPDPGSLSHSERLRCAGAGLVGGLLFDATTLGLRHITGAPSFPEDTSDLLVPFLPAATFNSLLSALGPHGKELLVVGALTGAVIAVVLLGTLYGGLVWRGWRPGRLATVLGVVGFIGLWALFGPVLDANDAGGTLLRRRAIGAGTLALDVIVSVGAVYLLVGRPRSREGGAGPEVPDRRAFLAALGGLGGGLLLGTGGLVAGFRSLAGATNLDYEGRWSSAASPITPIDQHYVVSKNLVDPSVNVDTWRLQVDGLVRSPVTLTLDDLRRLPQRQEIVTLECISNSVGGGLMSTARWRGPRLAEVIGLAGAVDQRARFAIVSAVDGYFDSLPIDAALSSSTVVALTMNEVTLPDRHGFPARIVFPGHYGEKSMKWLARIEVAEHDHLGFYQRQGWSEDAGVRTWSRFDAIGSGRPLRAGHPAILRGHAFAGTRGIESVQVSTDGGTTWGEADLDAAISPYAWRFFTSHWTPSHPGTYVLVVRAVDGAGALQEERREDSPPRGSSGFHSVTAQVV